MKLIHLSDGVNQHKLFSRVKWAADWLDTTSGAVNQALYHGCRVKGWFAFFDLGGSYNSSDIDTWDEPKTEEELQIKNIW